MFAVESASVKIGVVLPGGLSVTGRRRRTSGRTFHFHSARRVGIGSAHPCACEQAGSHKRFSNRFGIVFPLRTNANQSNADLPEQSIHEGIAGAAKRVLMGGVIQFDGRHDPGGYGAIEDEIDMFLADAAGMAASPVTVAAGDDVLL
jgi:hypothetical protein